MLTEDNIVDGVICVKKSDVDSQFDARAYNDFAFECRRKMNIVKELEEAFLIVNPVLMIIMYTLFFITVFNKFYVAVVLFALQTLSLVVVAFKKNYLLHTASSLLMVLLEWRFLIIFVINVAIIYIINRVEKPLKKKAGYPKFYDVRIIYEEYNRALPPEE